VRYPSPFDWQHFLSLITMTIGTLFIIAAPSGAGKTTLVSGLLANDAQVRRSISYTTRAPRPGEVDGNEYHFIDLPQFMAMRSRGEFVESAEVHGNYYGTSRAWLDAQMTSGTDMLLEIDWQGARQIQREFTEAVGIFILPPDMEELKHRLQQRATDSPEVIARRLAAARDEMRHVHEFDFVIINKDLDVALGELIAAVRASRLRVKRQLARYPEIFRFFEQD
jgi:guanylate kinase